MGWNEVRNRISVPILTPDGISAMIDSCLRKDGKNKNHSRTIVMDDYKRPVDDAKSVSKEEVEKIQFSIIKYMAQSLLRDCDMRDSSRNISQFINGWKEKNPGLDITVRELQKIATMSDEDIRKSIKKNSGNNIDCFINEVYMKSCSLAGQHNGKNPIYPFEKDSEREKNTFSGADKSSTGYNKRLYLNPSHNNISTYKFLAEYIKKCIDRRIPFNMKGFGSDGPGLTGNNFDGIDGMILYSSNRYLDQHLECLEEVIKENPEIMSTFGSPIYTGARVKDENGETYYTICSGMPCYRIR